MIPLEWSLVLAAALFCIGVYSALARRNGIAILMGIELMLNAVNINLVAFWRYLEPNAAGGRVFALSVCTVAVAEAVVGLALMVTIWRTRNALDIDDMDLLHG